MIAGGRLALLAGLIDGLAVYHHFSSSSNNSNNNNDDTNNSNDHNHNSTSNNNNNCSDCTSARRPPHHPHPRYHNPVRHAYSGPASHPNTWELYFFSASLAHDVTFLCRSLGFATSCSSA